jgi:hypothetical protein
MEDKLKAIEILEVFQKQGIKNQKISEMLERIL